MQSYTGFEIEFGLQVEKWMHFFSRDLFLVVRNFTINDPNENPNQGLF
jgi:hypothetical protein